MLLVNTNSELFHLFLSIFQIVHLNLLNSFHEIFGEFRPEYQEKLSFGLHKFLELSDLVVLIGMAREDIILIRHELLPPICGNDVSKSSKLINHQKVRQHFVKSYLCATYLVVKDLIFIVFI